MYLLTFEDGTFQQKSTYTEKDIESVGDGILSIVRVVDGMFEEYFGGEWVEIIEFM